MDIFSTNARIVSNVINRLLNCRGIPDIYVYGKNRKLLDDIYPAIRLHNIQDEGASTGAVVYAYMDKRDDIERIMPWIAEERRKKDFILYVDDKVEILDSDLGVLGAPHHLAQYSGLCGKLFLVGVSFDIEKNLSIPDGFKVLAIIHFYNEADIIEKTIRYLLNQEVDIYLLDNWSDDGSFEIAQKCQSEFPDRIYLEQYPLSGRSENYEWYNQLERTEAISKAMDYDWYIHYDVDEIRISPWKDMTLRKAIYQIDRRGYNCIENNVIDFRFTSRDADNIFLKDTFYDFRHEEEWIYQLKTWKRSEQIDLKSSGGHIACVENPKIYPLKFLNRHYPLRTIQQAEKKVFQDRKPRFQKEQSERGWHGHYENFLREEDFIFKESELLLWREDTFQKLYIPLFLECGIRWNPKKILRKIELPKVEGQRIIIYGAGTIGRRVYPELAGRNQIVGWTDKDYQRLPTIYCEKIESPRIIRQASFDYIVVTVIKKALVQEILEALANDYGVPSEKILFVN